jgi:putative transposase
MPWRERSPMDQRLDLVKEHRQGLISLTELAAQYGVSRKTAYKWIERFDPEGADGFGLADRSRRPHASPTRTEDALVKIFLALRRKHPRYGAKKLLWLAERLPGEQVWPSRSTVHALLRREGLVRARPRVPRVRMPFRLAPITAPNGTWTIDYKGQFRTGDGRYCYPLTLRDGWSRFVLRCDGLLGTTLAATKLRFERAFAEYGLPARIRSDNGKPFAGIGLARLSTLTVWWMRLGIVVERIALGRPEQNGSHEQFHSVLKAHTARPPAANLRAQQRRFDHFRREYNDVRPHEALEGERPADRYTASCRPLPSRLPPVEYPGHMEVRRVSSSGTVSLRNRRHDVSLTLAQQYVGFEEVADGLWTLYFMATPLARFDERTGVFHALPVIPVDAGSARTDRGGAND